MVFANSDVTSHTLSVLNDATYTIRIHLFSTTELPSAEVTVQSRRGESCCLTLAFLIYKLLLSRRTVHMLWAVPIHTQLLWY